MWVHCVPIIQTVESIRGHLDEWERGRYITRVNTTIQNVELVKYEVGLRSFMEIGFKNMTKFICTVSIREKLLKIADEQRVF